MTANNAVKVSNLLYNYFSGCNCQPASSLMKKETVMPYLKCMNIQSLDCGNNQQTI